MKKIFIAALCAVLIISGCNGGDLGESVYYTPGNTSADTKPKGSSGSVSVGKIDPNAVKQNESGEVTEIPESLFLTMFNDIYMNPEDYLGKTLKFQGMFDDMYYEPHDTTYHYVMRYGPGCCGNDGNVGLEVTWDKNIYPAADSWVEAEGVLESYDENGFNMLLLRLNSLNVLPDSERGSERVDW